LFAGLDDDRRMARHREALVEIVGDPMAGEEALTRTAVRKLDYVLKRNRENH
jgi:hypothetical protein